MGKVYAYMRTYRGGMTKAPGEPQAETNCWLEMTFAPRSEAPVRTRRSLDTTITVRFNGTAPIRSKMTSSAST